MRSTNISEVLVSVYVDLWFCLVSSDLGTLHILLLARLSTTETTTPPSINPASETPQLYIAVESYTPRRPISRSTNY